VIEAHRVLSDRYETAELLGEGGMARVYRGLDRVLDRTVAIKVLSGRLSEDDGFVVRFRREAQAAAGLNHPNIVAIFDTGRDDGVHYIVMEYVRGRTLSAVLRAQPRLPLERIVRIVDPVCSALAYAHGHGLIHRDIKPGNIMLTDHGDVKLTDFGIARALSSDTLTDASRILGTAAYLSPEQARGDRVDARSDIYAVGVVLYQMVTGRVPFEGESPVAVAYRHQFEAPVRPAALNPECPPALEAAILRCLAKRPDDRWHSVLDIPAALRSRSAPLPATESAAVPTAPGRRRRRWAVVAATLAAVVLGALLIALAISAGGVNEPGLRSAASPSAPAATTTGPPPSPQQTTEGPPAVPSVQEALVAIEALLEDGPSSGAVRPGVARGVAHEVEDAVEDYQEGKLDDARDELEKAREEVEKGSGSDQITDQYASVLLVAIDALESAMEATGSGEDGGD
jgi:hypothetical protein